MVFFSTAIAALLVSQAAASREKIAGYEPGSQVTDHVRLLGVTNTTTLFLVRRRFQQAPHFSPPTILFLP